MRLLTLSCLTLALCWALAEEASAQKAPQSPTPSSRSTTVKSERFIVTGEVLDSVSQKGVEYATIAVTDTAGRVVHMAAADGSGKFRMELKQRGQFKLALGSLGYGSRTSDLLVDGSATQINTGTHFLVSGVNMQEVVVAVQKPIVTSDADKLTYSVEADPESKTSSLVDILRKVPQLAVDGEDNVLLNGQSDYKVLVNGKNSAMYSKNFKEIIRSLPANSIKDIEVITNPSTKYEAEGVGGIINIITSKKVAGGYNGSINFMAGSQDSYNAYGYFATQAGKLTISGRYGYGSFGQPDSRSTTRRENFLSDQNRYSNVEGFSSGTSRHQNGSLEGSYEIDSLNLITLSFWGYDGKSPMRGEVNTQFLNADHQLTREYKSISRTKNQYGGLSGSVDYQRLFKKPDRTLTFSYKLESDPGDSEYSNIMEGPGEVNGQPNLIPPSQSSWNDANDLEHTAQIDFFNPITKKHQMEVGAKYIMRLNTSESETFRLDGENWVLDNTRMNDLDYTQHIIGMYGGYVFKVKKLTAKAGFRMEGTINDGAAETIEGQTTFDNKLFNVVPYVNFSYQIKPTQTIRLSYTQRLRRPGIRHLNPYVNDQDPANIQYGNPDLKATVSNSFSVNYNIATAKWNLFLGATAALSNNAITSYKFVNAAGISESTVGNIGKEERYTLNGSYSYRLGTKFSINLGGRVNYSVLEAKRMEMKNEGFSYNGNMSVNVGLWKNAKALAYLGLYSPQISLQGSGDVNYYHGLGITQQLFKKKVDVGINVSSPFQKSNVRTRTSSDDTFYEISEFEYQQRRLMVSVGYRFGKMQTQVKKARRTVNNDDKLEGGSSASGGAAGATGGGN